MFSNIIFINICKIRLNKYIEAYNERAPEYRGPKNPYEMWGCSCVVPAAVDFNL